MPDDLKASVLPAYGNIVCKIPNLDRLAASGMVFESAYCQGLACAPATQIGNFCKWFVFDIQRPTAMGPRESSDPRNDLAIVRFVDIQDQGNFAFRHWINRYSWRLVSFRSLKEHRTRLFKATTKGALIMRYPVSRHRSAFDRDEKPDDQDRAPSTEESLQGDHARELCLRPLGSRNRQ